jgi:hypothetical protein
MSVKLTSPQFVAPTPLKTEYDGSFYHRNLLLPKLLEAALSNCSIIDTQQEVDPTALKTAVLFVRLARMENEGSPRFPNFAERAQLHVLYTLIQKDLGMSPAHPALFDETFAIHLMKKHSLKIYEWTARI